MFQILSCRQADFFRSPCGGQTSLLLLLLDFGLPIIFFRFSGSFIWCFSHSLSPVLVDSVPAIRAVIPSDAPQLGVLGRPLAPFFRAGHSPVVGRVAVWGGAMAIAIHSMRSGVGEWWSNPI